LLRPFCGAVGVEPDTVLLEHVGWVAYVIGVVPVKVGAWLPVGAEHPVASDGSSRAESPKPLVQGSKVNYRLVILANPHR
jgi:hypothetical protein